MKQRNSNPTGKTRRFPIPPTKQHRDRKRILRRTKHRKITPME